jgi:glucose/arabinose dehydrogenase
MQRFSDVWLRLLALLGARKGLARGAGLLITLAAVGVALVASCTDSRDGAGPTPSATVAPTSIPATPTPPPGTPRPEAYRLAPAVTSATWGKMLGFVMFPGSDDEAAVIQQTGAIWRVSISDAFEPALVANLSDRLIDNPGLEEGLLGFAYSPRFESDGRVYVYYSGGEPRRNVLSRFIMRDRVIDTTSEQVLIEVRDPFPNHNGGHLAFGPDGMLYVALGDGGAGGDPLGNGQNLGTLFGSILRIDVSGDGYTVPQDNPFVGQAGARGEIWAYGFRNPWRFSFDRETGDLWAGDVGQDRWEEVDLVKGGSNYGWNTMEGFACYAAGECNQSGLQPPRTVYDHGEGCSVTGGFVYRGDAMPELTGWYVFGDYCSGNIWAVNTADSSDPVLLARSEKAISSFGELPDGEIVAVTFNNAIFALTRG